MPSPYNSSYLKIGRVWFLVVKAGETYANLDSNAPVGSIATDPDNEKLYYKKTAGWKEVTVAT